MKELLELEAFNGSPLMIDANSIVAIEKTPNMEGACTIYCHGISTPLVARITHFKLFEKLRELEVAELVKF
jgi:hypothetical protein